MTPIETHIAINSGLQKLGSFAYDNIKSEIIDSVFNRMGDAYITEKTTKSLDPKQIGFEENQTRLSTIRELITEPLPLIVYNDIALKRQQAVLPFNYFSYIESSGDVVFSCNSSAVTFSSINASEYISIISFKVSDFGIPLDPPFANVRVHKVINGTPIEIFDFSDFSTGLSDIDEIFTVVNKILDEINRTQSNLKVYWEYYRGTYSPDSLIFISTDSTFLGQSIKVDYTVPLTSTIAFAATTYTKPTTGIGSNYDEKDGYCRLLSNEDTFHMLAHPFGTTSPESPILNILNDKIVIYINERFILKGLTLKYIRKPRRMSLPLNQSYEIQDSRAVAKIVDMTVEYLSATITSQGLQALTIQNQQRD